MENATRSCESPFLQAGFVAPRRYFPEDYRPIVEPSNMLDVPSVAYLAHYLLGYPSTVLVVSHDRYNLQEQGLM